MLRLHMLKKQMYIFIPRVWSCLLLRSIYISNLCIPVPSCNSNMIHLRLLHSLVTNTVCPQTVTFSSFRQRPLHPFRANTLLIVTAGKHHRWRVICRQVTGIDASHFTKKGKIDTYHIWSLRREYVLRVSYSISSLQTYNVKIQLNSIRIAGSFSRSKA